MTLDNAMNQSGGLPIRLPEMNGQMLVQNGSNYYMTGTCNGPHEFTNAERSRNDWIIVDPQTGISTADSLSANPANIKADFPFDPTSEPIPALIESIPIITAGTEALDQPG